MTRINDHPYWLIILWVFSKDIEVGHLNMNRMLVIYSIGDIGKQNMCIGWATKKRNAMDNLTKSHWCVWHHKTNQKCWSEVLFIWTELLLYKIDLFQNKLSYKQPTSIFHGTALQWLDCNQGYSWLSIPSFNVINKGGDICSGGATRWCQAGVVNWDISGDC